MKDRLVAVLWRDPRVDQGNAYTRDEIAVRTIPTFTTFGLLVRDDEEVVAVAAEQGEDGAFRGVTYIMRPLVRAILPICEWPKRQRRQRGTRPARTSEVLRADRAHAADSRCEEQ